jgi:hypothetical protein
MFRLPSYAPLAVGIWLAPAIICLIILPVPFTLAWLAPPPYGATVSLQYRSTFVLGDQCHDVGRHYWMQVVEGPHSSTWFRALALEGPSPVARAYGLIGLQAVAPEQLPEVLSLLPAGALSDTVRFAYADRARWMWQDSSKPLRAFADTASLNRYRRLLVEPQPHYGCS